MNAYILVITFFWTIPLNAFLGLSLKIGPLEGALLGFSIGLLGYYITRFLILSVGDK